MNSSTTENPEQKTSSEIGVELRLSKVSLVEGDTMVVFGRINPSQAVAKTLIWEVLTPANRFEVETGAVAVGPGAEGSFSLKLKENSVFDADSRARIQVRDQDGVLATTEFSVVLLDNDQMPFVFVGDAEAVRGSRINIPVTLSAASGTATEIDWSTVDATAVSGRDYVGAVGKLIIPPGETSGTIAVTSLANAKDSTFVLQLTAANGGRIADGTATIHIQGGNNLEANISFRSSQTRVDEGAGTANVIVDLSRALPLDVTFKVVVAGLAKPGVDYTAPGTQFTIPAGQLTATISVPLANDALFEKSEDITIELQDASNADFGINTKHTVLITDNDPMPTLSVFDAQAEEGNAIVFSVTLDQVSGMATTFSFKTTENTAGVNDYTNISGTVTIPEGSTIATVQVQTFEDSLFESGEDFSFLLASAAGASLLRANAKGTVLDNDIAPLVQFRTASQSVAANQTQVSIHVDLATVSGTTTSIPFGVSGDGIAGIDHNLVPSVVTIPAGQTSAEITFSVFKHGPPTKQVILDLGSPTNATLGAVSRHSVSF